MGCIISKGSGDSAHSPSTTSTSQVNPDLSSYVAACRVDPDLQSFDSHLQQRTSRVINSLSVGVDVPSLSIDSLRGVTDCFLETDQEVVNMILACKRDVWNNKDLSDLVEDYFETSLETLKFCTALEHCLRRVGDSQLIVQSALRRFEEEQRQGSSEENGSSYSKTLQELRNFKSAGSPFTEEFFKLFQSVYAHQNSIRLKLLAKKTKLDKKLKKLKAWRKVSNIILGAAFASVLICSVVAAAVSAPPVVTALAAAASVPVGSVGKWFNSIWNKYENEIKNQGEIIGAMHFGTHIAIKDLDGVKSLVNKLEIEIESLLQSAEFATQEEDAVIIAMDEIKKRLNGFMEVIERLGVQCQNCSRFIRQSRSVILQRIIKYPST